MPKDAFIQVHETADEILNSIVAPICSVTGVAANIYTATLSTYDGGNPQNRQAILAKIIEKYGVDKNGLEAIQDCPLALIALYILDKE